MKQTLILLAGYPAAGKTYLCNLIWEQFPEFVVVSQDTIKEEIWDEYGFNNCEEKIRLELLSWEKYYKIMEENIEKRISVISDYPFSDKQKNRLQALTEKYQLQVVTIRLIGDLEILFQRSLKRDLDNSRHLGHLATCYHKGDVMEDRSQAYGFVTHEIFMERCKNRGYNTFELGFLIEIDVTDYNKIDYNEMLDKLGDLLQ